MFHCLRPRQALQGSDLEPAEIVVWPTLSEGVPEESAQLVLFLVEHDAPSTFDGRAVAHSFNVAFAGGAWLDGADGPRRLCRDSVSEPAGRDLLLGLSAQAQEFRGS